MAQRIDTLKNGYKILQDDKAFSFGCDAVFLSEFAKIKNGSQVVDLGTGNAILPLLLCKKCSSQNSSSAGASGAAGSFSTASGASGAAGSFSATAGASSASPTAAGAAFEGPYTTSGISANFKKTTAFFTGIEIQKSAVAMARETVRLNHLEDRIKIVEGDLKNIKNLLPPRSAHTVLSNPPYMTVEQSHKNSTDEKSIARHEVLCSLQDVINAAAYLLRPNGTFYMIHRPYRLGEIFTALDKVHLTPRRLQFIYPKIDKSPEMVLIEARPNYKPDLKIEPPVIMY